jgi:uncharacterized protein YqjF (DUF2071 family)
VTTATATFEPSKAGQRRLLAKAGEPLFLATWDKAVFVHYETDPALLQRQIPFQLDLFEGRAFVSVVAFTLRRMRPRIGGRFGEWLFRPIATHEFMNVRTYVRANDEPGIFFLVEWLSNRLSVPLGPPVFGLPYRYGRISYHHSHSSDEISGRVDGKGGCFSYRGTAPHDLRPCGPGSLTEFLMERYTAFTQPGSWRPRLFRVWHKPWEQTPIEVEVLADSLMASTGAWWNGGADLAGANYSPGVEVWMGRPHRLPQANRKMAVTHSSNRSPVSD